MLLVHQTLIASVIFNCDLILYISSYFFYCLLVFIFLFLVSIFYSVWKNE